MFKNLLLIALLIITTTAFALQTGDYDSPLPVDPDLVMGKLPNGLTYYIKVNRKPEKRAELRLVANVGSVQEDEDQLGLAHFLEHMAFNGTKHFPKSELVDYLNSIGMGYAAGLNAGTGFDQTVYQLKIPTDNQEQFRKGFLILSDWACGISFDPVEIDKERGVVIEELRGGQGADQRIYDQTRQVIFAGSRYAERMPIGKLEILQSFQPDTIKRYYNDWYRPDLQAVVAVGDFDPVVVENLIIEYFGSIPTKENPREALLYDVPDHPEPKVVIATDIEASSTSVQIIWKHDTQSNDTVADYRKSLINNLYTQMLNARLQELALQPEPPFSQGFNYKYNMVRSKATYAMAAVVDETGIMTGLNALLTEAERVNRFGFTPTELDRAKQNSIRQAERMLAEKDKQDSGRLVWRYVGHYTFGNPVMSVEQNVLLNRSLYDSITLAEVNAVCRELVTDENMVIAVAAPEKDGLALPAEADILALTAQVNASQLTAYEDTVSQDELLAATLKPGKVKSQKNFKKVGVKQWTLSNGIKVLHKQTDFKNDEVMLRAFSPGGTSLYDLQDLFEARQAAGVIMESGISGFDPTALSKKLAGKIVSVIPFIDSESEGFSANSSVADLETMFQLIYLYATSPNLTAESYAAWLARTRTWLQNEALSPESAFQDSVSFFQMDRHPRSRKIALDDLETLDMNRILQIYQERFADFSDFTFVIIGNYDEKQLKDYCTKYLANLPARGVKEKVRDNGVRFAQGIRNQEIYRGQDEKSIVQFAITGSCKLDAKTKNQLRNLTFLMNEKLRENIRETRSGVYFIGSWGDLMRHPEPSYQIQIYMQCAPERVEELSGAVLATLDSLRAGLFEEKYVNVIKVTRQKRLEIDTKDNRWWLSSIYSQAANEFPLNDLLKDMQAIDQLTHKELKAAAEQFLDHRTNLLRSVLYPAPRLE